MTWLVSSLTSEFSFISFPVSTEQKKMAKRNCVEDWRMDLRNLKQYQYKDLKGEKLLPAISFTVCQVPYCYTRWFLSTIHFQLLCVVWWWRCSFFPLCHMSWNVNLFRKQWTVLLEYRHALQVTSEEKPKFGIERPCTFLCISILCCLFYWIYHNLLELYCVHSVFLYFSLVLFGGCYRITCFSFDILS